MPEDGMILQTSKLALNFSIMQLRICPRPHCPYSAPTTHTHPLKDVCKRQVYILNKLVNREEFPSSAIYAWLSFCFGILPKAPPLPLCHYIVTILVIQLF